MNQKHTLTFKQKCYLPIKRLIDLVLSVCGLIVLSPLLIAIVIAIKLDSKGPVIFKQKRVGKNKTYFNIWKFRTMRTDAPKDMPTHLLSSPDAYITKIGKFLRQTSLDELPQILQIVVGKMAIIGPRPALWNQYDLIEERDNGKAVLVVSFELDEILNVSDRIAVIHDGKIQGIVSPETTNKQELGVLMAGGNLGKEKSDV